MRFVANDVTAVVIANSGHWLMDELPAKTMAAIRGFLDLPASRRRCVEPASLAGCVLWKAAK
jgi:hypothetical protein